MKLCLACQVYSRFSRMEGTTFGNVPLELEAKLDIWDSPILLVAPSSYYCKSPPQQFCNSECKDLVITVCDNAAEQCPAWLGSGKRMHIGFPDPEKVTGTQDLIPSAFRAVRDDIIKRIPRALNHSER